MNLVEPVRELTNSDDWSKQEIGTRGKGVFDTLLPTNNILSMHDYYLWDIMSDEQPGCLACVRVY